MFVIPVFLLAVRSRSAGDSLEDQILGGPASPISF